MDIRSVVEEEDIGRKVFLEFVLFFWACRAAGIEQRI
jgi:hypothetical protein